MTEKPREQGDDDSEWERVLSRERVGGKGDVTLEPIQTIRYPFRESMELIGPFMPISILY